MSLAAAIYDEFLEDDEEDGVDFATITSGLSVLCAATMDDKVRRIFMLWLGPREDAICHSLLTPLRSHGLGDLRLPAL